MQPAPVLREVCYLVGADGEVLWRDCGTEHALPDSRERWKVIWEHRSRLAEIAHTHPSGPLAFSSEDWTTMQAVWAALGREVVFSVVTSTGMIRLSPGNDVENVSEEPRWVSAIRRASGLQEESPAVPGEKENEAWLS